MKRKLSDIDHLVSEEEKSHDTVKNDINCSDSGKPGKNENDQVRAQWSGPAPRNMSVIIAAKDQAIVDSLAPPATVSTFYPAYRAAPLAHQQTVAKVQIYQAWKQLYDSMADKFLTGYGSDTQNNPTIFCTKSNRLPVRNEWVAPKINAVIHNPTKRFMATSSAEKLHKNAAGKEMSNKHKPHEAVGFTPNFYNALATRYGRSCAIIAKKLVDNATGKNIRNADLALQALDNYRTVLSHRFNIKDRRAMINVLERMDINLMENNFLIFTNSFGLNVKHRGGMDCISELQSGIETGHWNPFFAKLVTLTIVGGASSIISLIFAIMTASRLRRLEFVFLMTIVSSLINDEMLANMIALMLAITPS